MSTYKHRKNWNQDTSITMRRSRAQAAANMVTRYKLEAAEANATVGRLHTALDTLMLPEGHSATVGDLAISLAAASVIDIEADQNTIRLLTVDADGVVMASTIECGSVVMTEVPKELVTSWLPTGGGACNE